MEELREKGELADYETVLDEIKKRDLQDMTRKNSPLIVPEGALKVANERKSID